MWQPSWVFPSILSAGYAQKNRRLPFFFAFKQKNFASHGVSLRSENINQTTEKKQMSHISSSAFSDTKAHYDLLDGLRGVAALMVIWYHIFEGYAFAGGSIIETFNHGYLAVDFFFILSGFVIGYAYDDRWGRNLTMKNFFKRRLIRLHPMVIMGAVRCHYFLSSRMRTMGRNTYCPLHDYAVPSLHYIFYSRNARCRL